MFTRQGMSAQLVHQYAPCVSFELFNQAVWTETGMETMIFWHLSPFQPAQFLCKVWWFSQLSRDMVIVQWLAFSQRFTG